MCAMSAKVVYRAERRVWEVRYYRDGGRSRKSFNGADGETKAREFAAAVEVEANAASRWMAGDGGPIRIDEALRGWLATYRSTLSRSYETTARGLIEGHLVPHFGSRSLRSLTEADAMAFADRVLDLGRSPAVIRNALSIVRRVAQLHVEAGLLQRNPFGHVGRLVARIERRQATRGPRDRRVDARGCGVDPGTRTRSTCLDLPSPRLPLPHRRSPWRGARPSMGGRRPLARRGPDPARACSRA